MVMDDKLNFSIHGLLVSILMIFGGMLIMNYVYYGVFFIISIFIFMYLYSLLKTYLSVASVLLQMAEKSRAELIRTYMNALKGSVLFRSLGK